MIGREQSTSSVSTTDSPQASRPAPALTAPEPRETVLEINGLNKSYGKVQALRSLDLRVGRGEVYGFLGRNGAGKSTTIRILVGITKPTSGSFRLFGQPGGQIAQRQRIGYVAQEQNFYGWMTPASIGRFVRGFYPRWDDSTYSSMIADMDLPIDRKIRTFSGGMKVKLALALALAHDPELLVLDEPTAGLDPVARREFLEMVRDQAESSGRTTFFSTHLIDEIELAAHRVGIVNDGRTRYEGSISGLAARVRLLRCAAPNPEDVPPLPYTLDGPNSGFRILQDRLREGERQVIVETDDPARFDLLPYPPFTALEGLLIDHDWSLEELPLEEIFIEMVRKPLAA